MIRIEDIIEIDRAAKSLEITIPLSLKYGNKNTKNRHRASQFKRYIYIEINRMGIWIQLTLKKVYGKRLYTTKFGRKYCKKLNDK